MKKYQDGISAAGERAGQAWAALLNEENSPSHPAPLMRTKMEAGPLSETEEDAISSGLDAERPGAAILQENALRD